MVHDLLAATSPLNSFFDWVQHHWGETATPFHRSYAAALLEAWNAWGLLEGAHILTMMWFFGTIMLVDMRLMGLAFRKTPISVISDKLLSVTVASMIILVLTGMALFFAKPQDYYHNFWFRLKMLLLAAAIANIYIFHKIVQKDQVGWDTAETPPSKARLSGLISLTSWVAVIFCGRLIAYNFLDCGKPHAAWINWFAECATSPVGAITQADYERQMAEEAAAPAAPAPAPDAAAKPEAK